MPFLHFFIASTTSFIVISPKVRHLGSPPAGRCLLGQVCLEALQLVLAVRYHVSIAVFDETFWLNFLFDSCFVIVNRSLLFSFLFPSILFASSPKAFLLSLALLYWFVYNIPSRLHAPLWGALIMFSTWLTSFYRHFPTDIHGLLALFCMLVLFRTSQFFYIFVDTFLQFFISIPKFKIEGISGYVIPELLVDLEAFYLLRFPSWWSFPNIPYFSH